MKYARIVNNAAVDTRTESPEGVFHPDIAAQFAQVPDYVEDGFTVDGDTWMPPAAPEAPEPAPVAQEFKKVSPIEFKLLFNSMERIQLKTSADPIVQDFFEIINDPRLTHVDLGLQSVQNALLYLVSLGVITMERRTQILAGEAQ
jgi:hypothetical protein